MAYIIYTVLLPLFLLMLFLKMYQIIKEERNKKYRELPSIQYSTDMKPIDGIKKPLDEYIEPKDSLTDFKKFMRNKYKHEE